MINQEQIKNRRNYIGGSDISIILNISKYKTPYQLYLEKIGEKEIESSDNSIAKFGQILEKSIALEYIIHNKTNPTFFNSEMVGLLPNFKENTTFYHPKYDFFAANIDGIEDDTILEIKTKHSFDNINIDNLPCSYFLQANWYMFILDKPSCKFLILDKIESKYLEIRINKNENIIEIIKNQAIIFWDKVQQKIPPEKNKNDDFQVDLIKESYKKANKYILSCINNLKKVKKSISELNREKEILELEIKRYIDNNELIINDKKEKVVSYKECKIETIDKQYLKNCYHDIYEKSKIITKHRKLKIY